MKRE
ncbi:Protein of unknown function [Bacillus cereus]|jgi:hypothetical protein